MGENNHFMYPALYMKIVNALHVFVLAPLFVYVGLKAEKTPDIIFMVFLIVGIVVALYHSYRIFVTYQSVGLVPYIYINLVHILLVAPLLVYVGMKKVKTEKIIYKALIVFAVTMVLSNGYRLFGK
tara:strand:- start:4 stop:381 length:378 start_codon:yes stop_codon:yes gene_type:complete